MREYSRVLKWGGVLVLVTTRTLDELGEMLVPAAWSRVDVACIRIPLQAAATDADTADETRYEHDGGTEDNDDDDDEPPSVPRGAVGTQVRVDSTTLVATPPATGEMADHYVDGYQDFYLYRCLKQKPESDVQ